jgi:hypothetical protein
MTDLRRRLVEGDPLRNEATLAPPDVTRIRRRVIDAATAQPFVHQWTVSVSVAVVLLLVVAAGVGVTRSRLAGEPRSAALVEKPIAAGAPHQPLRRQLQFATPGGTRVIWIFNDAFDAR